MKSHQPVRYLQLRVVLRSLSLRDWYQPYVLVLILHRDEKGHHLYRPFFFLFCCGQYFVSPWQRRNEGCLTRVHQPVRHLRLVRVLVRVSWLRRIKTLDACLHLSDTPFAFSLVLGECLSVLRSLRTCPLLFSLIRIDSESGLSVETSSTCSTDSYLLRIPSLRSCSICLARAA